MAADPGIFASLLRPPKTVQDYINDDAQAEGNKLSLLMQRQQYSEGAAKLQDAQQARVARQSAYGAGDDNAITRALLSNPLTAAEGQARQKAATDNAHVVAQTGQATATAGKTNYETSVAKADKAVTDIASYQSPEQALQQLQAHTQAGDIDPQRAEVLRQQIQQSGTQPGGFAQWQVGMLRNILSAKDRLSMDQTRAIADQSNQTSIDNNVRTTTVSRDNNRATVGATIRGQNMTDARAGQAFNAPQYMETDAGLVALPKKLQPGQAPVGTPVMSAGGQPLGNPLKDIPAAVNGKIIEGQQSLTNIDRAIAAVQSNPSAFGLTNAIPGALTVKQFTGSQAEGGARAEVANIGSLKLHDRSGAAVSVSEFPRLAPFIPSASDSAATVVTKLQKMKQIAEDELGLYSETYSADAGYKPSPAIKRKGAAAPDIHAQADAILNGRK